MDGRGREIFTVVQTFERRVELEVLEHWGSVGGWFGHFGGIGEL